MHSNAAARQLFTLEFANWSSCPAQAPTFGLRYRGKVQLEEGVSGWGGTMTSAEHEPIMKVWGQSPQRGPTAEPLVRGLGGKAPLKLKAFWSLDVQRSRQI